MRSESKNAAQIAKRFCWEGLFRLALMLLPVGLTVWVNSATGWLVFGCTMMVLAAVATTRDELAGRLQRGLDASSGETARRLASLSEGAAAQAADLIAAVERERTREPCGYKRDWKADHPARWMNPNA